MIDTTAILDSVHRRATRLWGLAPEDADDLRQALHLASLERLSRLDRRKRKATQAVYVRQRLQYAARDWLVAHIDGLGRKSSTAVFGLDDVPEVAAMTTKDLRDPDVVVAFLRRVNMPTRQTRILFHILIGGFRVNQIAGVSMTEAQAAIAAAMEYANDSE